jgi:hypothetical protein
MKNETRRRSPSLKHDVFLRIAYSLASWFRRRACLRAAFWYDSSQSGSCQRIFHDTGGALNGFHGSANLYADLWSLQGHRFGRDYRHDRRRELARRGQLHPGSLVFRLRWFILLSCFSNWFAESEWDSRVVFDRSKSLERWCSFKPDHFRAPAFRPTRLSRLRPL